MIKFIIMESSAIIYMHTPMPTVAILKPRGVSIICEIVDFYNNIGI